MEKKKNNGRVRVGVIGSGHVHGREILNTFLSLPEVFEVAAYADVVASPTGEPYAALPRRSVADILADESIPAVVVETAEWDSLEVAERCADAGKAIHLDKPAGLDIVRFERILGKLKAQGLPFSMGYMYRTNAAVRYVLDKVRSGALGEIHEVNARMSTRHKPRDRDLLNRYPGGIMYFLVCHLIDLVYTVKGLPEEIYPFVVTHTRDGLTAPDDATLVLRYRDGTSVVRANSLEVCGFTRREFTVCGELGTVEVKPIEQPTVMREGWYDEDKTKIVWREVPVEQYKGRYDAMMCDFARMVRGEYVNPYTYEHEARLQRLTLAACGLDVDWKKEILL